ncbi:helical backbone metal receptor [Corynebacterium glucuronolyticum]|uniref:helical backbone metal receptor n=1 Tax=Corynebacterium glucuronolyticum TaxID=39791 RepID=UPI00223B2FE6|nr:helical backbone metal receptor [Corynebacterium glucuronolyticum]MCT1562877.1 helical backbone metal receptor [Corynebacterium glucuronolyticum]
MLIDDSGASVPLTQPARRVVSLVPSLTEAIALTAPTALVGATDWCTQPPDLTVTRVRGTKNPDITAIAGLRPDLVVVNDEENRRVDVEELRRLTIPVWLTHIATVDEALDSMTRLFTQAFRVAVPAWLKEARNVWSRPASGPRIRVALPIWTKPWRWVGANTFATDLMRHLGWDNVVTDERYPLLTPADIAERAPDVVVLPDEPYSFTATDHQHFPVPAIHVAGRNLFWYGPAMATAREELEEAMDRRQAK